MTNFWSNIKGIIFILTIYELVIVPFIACTLHWWFDSFVYIFFKPFVGTGVLFLMPIAYWQCWFDKYPSFNVVLSRVCNFFCTLLMSFISFMLANNALSFSATSTWNAISINFLHVKFLSFSNLYLFASFSKIPLIEQSLNLFLKFSIGWSFFYLF